MRTRLFQAAAAMTAIALLAACGGGTNAASTSGGGSTTLTLASVDQGSIADVVKAFEAANPGVTVRFTTAGADQTYDAIYGLNGIGAVYNQQALAKAGLTPPGTWTELLAFCRAAAAKGTPPSPSASRTTG